MARASAPTEKRGLTVAEKVARRVAVCARIQELLSERPMKMDEVAAAVGLAWGTVYNYMTQMEQEGQAARSGRFVKRAELWVAGAHAVELGKDSIQTQGASLQALEQALARPARGAAA
jgi:DNA-binding IclR family transcriptional regulator